MWNSEKVYNCKRKANSMSCLGTGEEKNNREYLSEQTVNALRDAYRWI